MSTKKDFAWEYGCEVVGKPKGYLLCKFCNKQCSGGINRLKNHLAGTRHGMAPCTQVPDDVKAKCAAGLLGYIKEKKKNEELTESIGRAGTSSRGSSIGDEPFDVSMSDDNVPTPTTSLAPRPRGAMDQFVSSTPSSRVLNTKEKKKERKEVCKAVGRFIYANALSFNLMNDPYWKHAVEQIANYGPGFKPPSMHDVRTWILADEVKHVDELMGEYKLSWKKYGCTIMSDGWTDQKGRCLINFLVNTPTGTMFFKSVDASDTFKDGSLMFKYLDQVVEEVGEENVVQIVTDNASNYVSAGQKLMEKRPHLFWTPCAAHCIDLILESIGSMKIFATTLAQAKQVTKFIYRHAWVLAYMRSCSHQRELIRPAVTRFATAYLTLQSLYKRKRDLQAMFSSEKWNSSVWANHIEGVEAKHTILFDRKFWNNVSYCVRSTVPIVAVLREVDSDRRPSMPFLYEMMDTAKERIRDACGNTERHYMPIWNKIDERWNNQLHRPLHAAGYYLNPQFRFEINFNADEEVRKGLYATMDRMMGPDSDERLNADLQLDSYDNALGEFGCDMAIKTRGKRSPVDWWLRYGSDFPELQRFAVRVLSLTCSASGCERNWSAFEQVHTKKRNRLEQQRLHALVFVMYNLKLRERHKRRIATVNNNIDPILKEVVDSDDEWITEEQEPLLPAGVGWLDDESLDVNVPSIRLVGVGGEECEEEIPIATSVPPSSMMSSIPPVTVPRKSSIASTTMQSGIPRAARPNSIPLVSTPSRIPSTGFMVDARKRSATQVPLPVPLTYQRKTQKNHGDIGRGSHSAVDRGKGQIEDTPHIYENDDQIGFGHGDEDDVSSRGSFGEGDGLSEESAFDDVEE